MWVSRNKIISSTQKKVISKRENYSQIDDADLITPECLFLRKKQEIEDVIGDLEVPDDVLFFVETDTLVRLKPSHMSLDFEKYVAKGCLLYTSDAADE